MNDSSPCCGGGLQWAEVLEGPAVGLLPRTALSIRPGLLDLRKLTLCFTTAVVLNLWAVTPLGSNNPFIGVS